jgi:outer membrane protein assembly factor BamE
MPFSAHKIPHRLAVILFCAALSACSWNFPYSIPIQQGNVITVEMIQELELGMDKRKVRFVLGTPLVTDAFHQDRWDYFYSYEHGFADRVQQRASLFFEGDQLVRIDANIDSRIDFHTVTDASENVIIVPEKEKGGFFAALTPAFIAREEEEAREEEIARNLDTGFNDPQPGSGDVAAGAADTVADPVPGPAPDPALDTALAAPAVIGPGLGDTATPSEQYAPNSSTEFNTSGAWSTTEPTVPVEVISAETEKQSRYLEGLFEDYGTAPVPVTAPAKPAAVPSVVTEPNYVPQPTRD